MATPKKLLTLSAVVAVVLASTVSGFFTNEQIKSCVNSIIKIDTLQQFEEEFVPQFLKLSETLDRKELMKCLNTQTDPIDDVKALQLAIDVGKEEDVCDYNYIRKVLARYHDARFTNARDHNLKNLFDFYAKKVLSKCKEVFDARLAKVQADNDYIGPIQTILNVIVRTKAIFLGENSYSASEALYELPAGPRVENLIYADEIVSNIKNKAYTLLLPAADESLAVFFEIQSACRRISAYHQNILYGIAEMARRGYTVAPAAGDHHQQSDGSAIADHVSLLAVAQVCEVIKLIEAKVHKDGDYMKLVFGRLTNTNDELDVFEPFEFDQSLAKSVTGEEFKDSVKSNSCYSNGSFMRLFFQKKCSNELNVDRNRVLRSVRKGLFSQIFLNRLGDYLNIFVPTADEIRAKTKAEILQE